MSYETIQLEMREAIALITLNRPLALNALTVVMGQEFRSAMGEAREHGARAVVLTGAGRAFCAGGDLREMQRIAEKEGRLEAFFDEPLSLIHDCVRLIRETPLPVIAAVNGVATGGGCNFALACDIVLAAESAQFNQAFIKIGLTPDCGGTFILPRLVGWRRATELLMTTDCVDAKTAAKQGLITSVVPDAQLQPAALLLAKKLANGPTAALARIKRLLTRSAA